MPEMTPATPPRTHRLPKVFHDSRPLKIGIFGGSFNPAHEGHGHIADMAARHLRLDEVWWLITLLSPLKHASTMAPFDDRFLSARKQASQCRDAHKMRVSKLEQQFDTSHSAQVLKRISERAPRCEFVWIMGADNLATFHRWHHPQQIAQTMAIAVVNRPGWRAAALGGVGAQIAGKRLPPQRLAKRLAPKHWCFIEGPLNPISATDIRNKDTLN